jgi:dephospho-CoA kinase
MPATGTFAVGLTGGIGSGKSLVAALFAARGAAIVDTDQIAHQLTAAGGVAMPAIRCEFGNAFLTSEGAMNRVKMREHVFADPIARKQLEAILHPLIHNEAERAAAHAHGAYLVLVVPLLIESGAWRDRLSRILVVDCPEQQQIDRVMNRSGLSETQVRAILTAQATRETRLAAADDVVTNDRGPAAVAPQIDRLHAIYMALAQAHATKQPHNL